MGDAMPDHDEHAADDAPGPVSRRMLLRLTALAATAAPALLGILQSATAHAQANTGPGTGGGSASGFDVVDATIARMGTAMDAGHVSAAELVQEYQRRIEAIDRTGPFLNSVLEQSHSALDAARSLDAERRRRGPRGPLHGIPILVKDNVEAASDIDHLQTTAGSLALVDVPVPRDSTTAARLRQAGAIILGKANLSEWANFRSTHSSSGWCGRGGQCNMPFVLDRNPCGSSSGSAAATVASLCAAAIATETDGSIVCPAGHNGVVGIKPTVGLTSRAGVIPISHTQDTIGVHGRTVADAATVLGALTGVDSRDAATAASTGHFHADYTQFLNGGGLRGTRLGVARNVGFGKSEKVDAIMETALQALRNFGATVIDVALTSNDDPAVGMAETNVLFFEFKGDIAKYLATRPGGPQTLADLIAYNKEDATRELKWFGQERFLASEAKDLNDTATYQKDLATSQGRSRDDINKVLGDNQLDAIVAPTNGPAWVTDLVTGDHFVVSSSGPCARAGYPIVTVPAGFTHGLPVNISFMGAAWSEPKLIGLAAAFEAVTHARQTPQYLPTLGPG
jgi:amidase